MPILAVTLLYETAGVIAFFTQSKAGWQPSRLAEAYGIW
jgi:hypothetical protein